jgi:hypothetical protein
MSIISTIIIGLIVGVIAKLLMPGKDPGRWLVTELAKRVVTENQQLTSEIAKLKERLNPESAAEELRIAQEQLRLDIEKARLEQLETIRSFEIVAPHAGILRISQ